MRAHRRVSYVIMFTMVHKRAVQSTLVTDFYQWDYIRITFNSYKDSNQPVSFRVISYLWLVSAVTRGPKYFIGKIRSLSVLSVLRWWPRKEGGSLNLVIINLKYYNEYTYVETLDTSLMDTLCSVMKPFLFILPNRCQN